MFLIIITCFSAFCCLVFAVLFLSILKKYHRIKSDTVKILLAVKRVRYGDINERIDKLNDKELAAVINRLFEAICDREMMIKEYQAALADKNLSLEKVLKQEKQLQLFKEEFTAALTHDMKVPVIAELNSLTYLLEGRFGSLNEKQTEVLKLMKSSNQELKELIENIIEIYRLEQKSLNLHTSENMINRFLEKTAAEMQPICIQSNHKIILNIKKTEKLKICFDEFQLKRVIKNLLQNAVNFSSESSNIIVTSQECGGNVKIFVTNEGQGISSEDLDLIFQKYYTGASKFTKAQTGLGLYLARQIMLAHEGNIEADCSKKGFTTFILTMPAM